jgi:Transposase zinc-binding domain/Putative transposase
MNRPPLEMADIVRFAGQSFLQRSQRWINWQHQKILLAITRCRTAALGGHRDRCSDCGHTAISYNSCRNRHRPKCQGYACQRWLRARERELLPTPYVLVVFTLPRELAPLALQKKQVMYNLLFQASAETLLEIARDPRHLDARSASSACSIPGISVCSIIPISTACLLPADSLQTTPAGSARTALSFFPSRCAVVSSAVSLLPSSRPPSGKRQIEFHGHLTPLAEPRSFASWLRMLFHNDWVVYAKRPFGGPEHALRYLGAYTHRVAISNHRLVAL